MSICILNAKEQKKQEKFEQAVVIEHFQQTEDAPVSLPTTEPSEESISSDDEIEENLKIYETINNGATPEEATETVQQIFNNISARD